MKHFHYLKQSCSFAVLRFFVFFKSYSIWALADKFAYKFAT